MKNRVAIAAIGLVGLQVGSAAAIQRFVCDPQKSVLCAGLSNVFQMEEDTDRNRDSVDGGIQLLEAPNTDVARAAGKVDSYAASFSGADGTYLYIPRGGSLIKSSTVAMWIYPTSAASEQIILSADEATKHGPYLSLVPSAGNVKVKGVAYYGDGRGDVSVTSTSTMTLNAWHLVLWGYDQAEASDFLTTSQTGRVMYVQVDNGAREKVGLAYFPIVGPFNDLVMGQRKGSGVGYTMPYSGRVDQLTFASRTWDSVDATEFYNAGAGKVYPFAPTSYASLNDGLVAYWKLDEVGSGTRYDSVNQHNFTDTNVGTATGKISNAAVFNGASAYLSTPDSADFQVNSSILTIGGWFYATTISTGTHVLATKSNAGSEYQIAVSSTGSPYATIVVYHPSGSCQASTPAASVTTATWYLVVADYDTAGKTCRIQLNNGTIYTGTTTQTISAGSGAFMMGGDAQPAYLFDGRLDEWGVWRRVLDTTDRSNLYNSGSGRTYPF